MSSRHFLQQKTQSRHQVYISSIGKVRSRSVSCRIDKQRNSINFHLEIAQKKKVLKNFIKTLLKSQKEALHVLKKYTQIPNKTKNLADQNEIFLPEALLSKKQQSPELMSRYKSMLIEGQVDRYIKLHICRAEPLIHESENSKADNLFPYLIRTLQGIIHRFKRNAFHKILRANLRKRISSMLGATNNHYSNIHNCKHESQSLSTYIYSTNTEVFPQQEHRKESEEINFPSEYEQSHKHKNIWAENDVLLNYQNRKKQTYQKKSPHHDGNVTFMRNEEQNQHSNKRLKQKINGDSQMSGSSKNDHSHYSQTKSRKSKSNIVNISYTIETDRLIRVKGKNPHYKVDKNMNHQSNLSNYQKVAIKQPSKVHFDQSSKLRADPFYYSSGALRQKQYDNQSNVKISQFRFSDFDLLDENSPHLLKDRKYETRIQSDQRQAKFVSPNLSHNKIERHRQQIKERNDFECEQEEQSEENNIYSKLTKNQVSKQFFSSKQQNYHKEVFDSPHIGQKRVKNSRIYKNYMS